MKIYIAVGFAIAALTVAAVSSAYSLVISAQEIDLARQVELDNAAVSTPREGLSGAS